MGQSVENIIPADEQDTSKFAQRQLSRDHDDPSGRTSSKGLDGSMSGSFDKIPQHRFLKFSTLPQYVNKSYNSARSFHFSFVCGSVMSHVELSAVK